jgi:TonB dependent receptor-like, beta-barrel
MPQSTTDSYLGFFVQDQWRITPKLTLNYGLRWDFEASLTQIINHDYRGWQPRVGLAYSPTKRTAIRASYGIFDDHYNTTFFFTNVRCVPAPISLIDADAILRLSEGRHLIDPGLASGTERDTARRAAAGRLSSQAASGL